MCICFHCFDMCVCFSICVYICHFWTEWLLYLFWYFEHLMWNNPNITVNVNYPCFDNFFILCTFYVFYVWKSMCVCGYVCVHVFQCVHMCAYVCEYVCWNKTHCSNHFFIGFRFKQCINKISPQCFACFEQNLHICL